MKPEDFELFAAVVRQRSGLALMPDKAYLLESRMAPLARKLGLASIEDIISRMRAKPDEALLNQVTEAMTTNESFFFRDQHPFDQFRKLLLPYMLQTRAAKKKIRLWSAAASSGQEAYSLAMICSEEAVKLSGWTVEILGTDLSGEMVARAKEGIYTQFEVQRGLPITMQVKYFKKVDENRWQIAENIRKMVQFRTGNLIRDFGGIGVFDIIYCRNVLIYFDAPTKTKVFAALRGALAPDGGLLLGGAETVLGLTDCFKPVLNQRGLYAPASQPEPFKLAA